MKKDPTIINMLYKLKHEVLFNEVHLANYWDGDYCAIGFELESKLMYVNTFNYLNEIDEKYDYDLEITENKKSKTIKAERGVNYQQLKEDFIAFFS